MTDSAHAQYRCRLTNIRRGDWVRPVIAAISGEARSEAWVRTFARFDPGQEPWASFVFQRVCPHESVVRVGLHTTNPEGGGSKPVRLPGIGWADVSPITADARLTAIGALLAESRQATVLRYRPGRRCTLGVRRQDGEEWQIAKVFVDDRGRGIDEATRVLFAASRDGRLGFRVPRPREWDAQRRTLWQEFLPGHSINTSLLAPGGHALARRIGRAAGSLPASALTAAARLDAFTQLERSRRTAAEVSRRIPNLDSALRELLDMLSAAHDDRSDPARLRPVHGAPHPSQWLVTDMDIALVDLDRYSLAEPELDCATFLAEVDFEGGAPDRREAVNDAFITGYESTAGDLDRCLLETYRVHKHLAKVLRLARALRPDGDVRAAAVLDGAMRRMGGVLV